MSNSVVVNNQIVSKSKRKILPKSLRLPFLRKQLSKSQLTITSNDVKAELKLGHQFNSLQFIESSENRLIKLSSYGMNCYKSLITRMNRGLKNSHLDVYSQIFDTLVVDWNGTKKYWLLLINDNSRLRVKFLSKSSYYSDKNFGQFIIHDSIDIKGGVVII